MYNLARAIEGLVDEPKILGWPRVMVRGFLGKLGFPGRLVVAIIGIFLNHPEIQQYLQSSEILLCHHHTPANDKDRPSKAGPKGNYQLYFILVENTKCQSNQLTK